MKGNRSSTSGTSRWCGPDTFFAAQHLPYLRFRSASATRPALSSCPTAIKQMCIRMIAVRSLSLPLSAIGVLTCSGAFADAAPMHGSDVSGFAEVGPGQPLQFPKDLGPHPGFRIEWWYLTANLKDGSGTRYGVQWTLFRRATEPGPEREGWSNQNIWMGHAAVTTANDQLFSETFARGGIGQAGASAAPFRVWIDDWTMGSVDPTPDPSLSRLMVSASGKGFRYSLDLRTDKPLVLHGDKGYHPKAEHLQASYYFSQPFFKVDGTLTLQGKTLQVSGHAWMDREWTSELPKGWDWFSIHFSNGQKLMLYRFTDSTGHELSAGTWINADGTYRVLSNEDLSLQPLPESKLPSGHAVPTGWLIRVKNENLSVKTTPLNPNSWMPTSFPYWEGPIIVSGSQEGEGYLEMVGY